MPTPVLCDGPGIIGPFAGRKGKEVNDTPKLNDDATALITIRQFLASQTKHETLRLIDFLVVAYLISVKAEDHDVWPSQLTLARMFKVDTRTIARSLARLVKVGYISVEHRKGRTNLYAINYEAVPGEECLTEKATQNARNLSLWYQQILVKDRHRKKFPKRWLGQQFLSAQRIIDKCKGDVETAGSVILYALSAKAFQKKATQSLYNVLTLWKRLAPAYNAHRKQEKEQEAAALQAQATQPTQPPQQGTATEAA
jgi:predicted transcriptional regulator